MFTNKIYLIPLSVSSQISSINLQIRSDPVTRIFPKLSFNDKGWSADSAAWFVPRLNRTFLPFIRKIHPVRGEKIHTTATSYRHATWPRFQWNNLICAYIYIYLNGGVRVSDLYKRGSQLIAPPTNVIEASLARMEISLEYRFFDWPTYTSHLTSRNTVSRTRAHTQPHEKCTRCVKYFCDSRAETSAFGSRLFCLKFFG